MLKKESQERYMAQGLYSRLEKKCRVVVSEHLCDRQKKHEERECDRTGRKKSRCIKVKRILFTEVGK